MSLINDALKRATHAQPAATPAAEPETPMQPVTPRQAGGLPVFFTPVVLCMVSGACWFFIKGFDLRQQVGLEPDVIKVYAREAPELASSSGGERPIPEGRQFALNDAPTPPVASSSSAVSENEAVAAAPVDETPVPVSFRLQGIFYRPGNSSAVVNSKTVFVGDKVSNAKIKAIDKQSVTIELAGETKVLTLE